MNVSLRTGPSTRRASRAARRMPVSPTTGPSTRPASAAAPRPALSRRVRPAARARVVLPTDATSPLFEAALEATEEAVYNSLFQATTVRSAIGTAEAIPVERVRELLGKREMRIYLACTVRGDRSGVLAGRAICERLEHQGHEVQT